MKGHILSYLSHANVTYGDFSSQGFFPLFFLRPMEDNLTPVHNVTENYRN